MPLRRYADLFEPEELAILAAAFDEAWSQIDSRFGSDSETVAAAKDRLAYAIVNSARGGCRDKAALVREGIERLRLSHGEKP